jgi:molecular chaperone GrpE
MDPMESKEREEGRESLDPRGEVDGDVGGNGAHAVGANAVHDSGPDAGSEAPGGAATETLQREFAALEDRYLRLAAEFENFRKRTRDELAQSRTRAQAAFLGTLLDVFDDLNRVHTVNQETATVGSVLEGIALLERKLYHALEEAGVTWVEPTGAPFDPASMDAVFRAPTEDAAHDDTVAQVFQRGVLLKEILVRPAKVSVFKAD